jgi:hypothetical protein
MKESEWQKKVIQIAHGLGWKIAHFKGVAMRRQNGTVFFCTPVSADGAGWPDLVMTKGKRLIAAELKVGYNRVSDTQKGWLTSLAETGVETYVWKPTDLEEMSKILGE